MSELGLIRTRALRQDVCRSHCLFLFLVSLSKSICYTKKTRFAADFRIMKISILNTNFHEKIYMILDIWANNDEN